MINFKVHFIIYFNSTNENVRWEIELGPIISSTNKKNINFELNSNIFKFKVVLVNKNLRHPKAGFLIVYNIIIHYGSKILGYF